MYHIFLSKQWFSRRDNVALPSPKGRGYLAMPGNISGCHNSGGGIVAIKVRNWYLVRREARDAAKHLTRHRAAPHKE